MEGGGHEDESKVSKVSVGTRMLRACALHRPPSVAARSPCRLGSGRALRVQCSAVQCSACSPTTTTLGRCNLAQQACVVPSGSERASTCSLAQAPPLAQPPRPTTSPGPALRTTGQAPHNTSCNMVRNPCSWTGRREGEGRANTAATAAAVQGHALTRSLPWCFILFFFVLFCFLGTPRQWLLFQTCALEKTSFTKKQKRVCAPTCV